MLADAERNHAAPGTLPRNVTIRAATYYRSMLLWVVKAFFRREWAWWISAEGVDIREGGSWRAAATGQTATYSSYSPARTGIVMPTSPRTEMH